MYFTHISFADFYTVFRWPWRLRQHGPLKHWYPGILLQHHMVSQHVRP